MRDLVELVGFALVIAFCVVVWWPSALLMGGLGLIVWAAFPARRSQPVELAAEGEDT